MGLEKKVISVDFGVGDTVQIVSGALESFCGKVISLNEATQKAMVNVSMFGRNTDVEVEFVQVKKIDNVVVEESFEENK
jgi:transcriptional antiterminator NusG